MSAHYCWNTTQNTEVNPRLNGLKINIIKILKWPHQSTDFQSF